MICNDQRFFHALMILLKFNQLMLGSIKLQLSNLMCNCCSSFDSSVHQRAAKSSCSTLIIKLEDIKARSLHINISIASTFPYVLQSLPLIKKNKDIGDMKKIRDRRTDRMITKILYKIVGLTIEKDRICFRPLIAT